MPTVLITGANRGIGLAFARRYVEDGWQVIATARDPDGMAAAGLDGSVTVLSLDVAAPDSVAGFKRALSNRPLDVVIHNAGIYGPRRMGFGAIDYGAWEQVLRVNGLGPMRVAEAVIDNLAAGTDRKLVAVSSNMGSIGNNPGGGDYIYRSSKALLNAAWRSLARDLAPRGVIACVVHPGWVRTDMGGPTASISVGDSVDGLCRVIAGLTMEQAARFWNYDGQELPW